MIKLDAFHPIFIDLAMSFKILNSTASRPIFLQLIARPINMGSIYPILYQNSTQNPPLKRNSARALIFKALAFSYLYMPIYKTNIVFV